MSVTSGNMYSIPEHPAEDIIEENYTETFLSVKETDISKVVKKISSTSLPEKTSKLLKNEINSKSNSLSITTEIKSEKYEDTESSKTTKTGIGNRLSVSLIDLPSFYKTSDSGSLKYDKENPFANVSSSHMNPVNNSKSYLEVQDGISISNRDSGYEKLLSPSGASASYTNLESISVKTDFTSPKRERKDSDNLIIIDLNRESDQYQSGDNLTEPLGLRQRSRSMQWIQNTFQNVSNRYKYLWESRRPSDIAEEQMRTEELEMEEHEYEIPLTQQSPTAGGRRYSENIIGKQKKVPFTSRILQFKDFWREKNPVTKKQEEKDVDRTRSDVCPLFSFPKKADEDEKILDAVSICSYYKRTYFFFHQTYISPLSKSDPLQNQSSIKALTSSSGYHNFKLRE